MCVSEKRSSGLLCWSWCKRQFQDVLMIGILLISMLNKLHSCCACSHYVVIVVNDLDSILDYQFLLFYIISMSKRDDILQQISSLKSSLKSLYHIRNDMNVTQNKPNNVLPKIAELENKIASLQKKITSRSYNFNQNRRRRYTPYGKIFKSLEELHNINSNPNSNSNPNPNSNPSLMQISPLLVPNIVNNKKNPIPITPNPIKYKLSENEHIRQYEKSKKKYENNKREFNRRDKLFEAEKIQQQMEKLELKINRGYSFDLVELEKLKEEYEKLMKNITQHGGGPLPLRYFDADAYQSSASAGSDVLGISGLEVRPKIGGRRAKRTKRASNRSRRTTKRMKGGFIPSIMEPFIFGCSKYIAPLAALSGWKLMNMPTKRKTKRVTRK